MTLPSHGLIDHLRQAIQNNPAAPALIKGDQLEHVRAQHEQAIRDEQTSAEHEKQQLRQMVSELRDLVDQRPAR